MIESETAAPLDGQTDGSGSLLALEYELVESWPPLAWLARLQPGAARVMVRHGRGVEVRPDFFCEAVWDAAFTAGDFDLTDIVFGSGARRRDGAVVFVSASATVDRLQFMACRGSTYVSNSLSCLLLAARARLDPTYPRYMMDLRSIVAGLEHYQRSLPTSRGPVELRYCENLRWDGVALRAEPKPWESRRFETFERYAGFLDATLGRLATNLSSPERAHPYRMMGTLSSGYDSPMVTVLGHRHGLEVALTFPEGREPLLGSRARPSESGERIGAELGVRTIRVSRDAWRSHDGSAILFLAGDGNGQEILFKGAEEQLAGAVLLTGMSGDTTWGRKPKGGDGLFARGDQSGLSLTEYRLHARFIHVPVPFIGANQASEVRALSNSEELRPWSVGGHYDRPIPRRVVEGAGIARDSFGVSKIAASVRFSLRANFESADFREDFLGWLGERRLLWLRRGRIPPDWISAAAHPFQQLLARAVRWLDKSRPAWAGGYRVRRRLEYLGGRELLYKYLFPWAVERTMEAYGCRRSGEPGAEPRR